MLRIVLFLLTNLAVVVVAGIVFTMFGVHRYVGGNPVALLVLFFLIGMGGAMISLFISKWMAKKSMGVYVIEQPRTAEERWLMDTVAELAHKAGIGMPEVGVFPSHQSNAFATGWNKNEALVAVSEGLLRRFSRDEVKAVLGHEIGHVANGDMVTLSLIQGVMNTFVMFFAHVVGTIVDRMLSGRTDERSEDHGVGFGYIITFQLAQVVFGVLASVVVAWFSRRREFRADEAGATLTSRFAMTAALQRLMAESGQPVDMPAEMTAFGLRSGTGIAELFATHPPLEVRIRALQNLQ